MIVAERDLVFACITSLSLGQSERGHVVDGLVLDAAGVSVLAAVERPFDLGLRVAVEGYLNSGGLSSFQDQGLIKLVIKELGRS